MNEADIIKKWDIIKLFVEAQKKSSWIACISLGYTLLEMHLTYLLQSRPTPPREPVTEREIRNCKYMIKLAELAKDRGFIDSNLYDEIKNFNDGRRKAIHSLLSESVSKSELEETAKSISHLAHQIQEKWLTYTIGEQEIVQK